MSVITTQAATAADDNNTTDPVEALRELGLKASYYKVSPFAPNNHLFGISQPRRGTSKAEIRLWVPSHASVEVVCDDFQRQQIVLQVYEPKTTFTMNGEFTIYKEGMEKVEKGSFDGVYQIPRVEGSEPIAVDLNCFTEEVAKNWSGSDYTQYHYKGPVEYETTTETRWFFIGKDTDSSGSMFISQLPSKPSSIDEVSEILMPDEVKKAIKDGHNVIRQGEFYLVDDIGGAYPGPSGIRSVPTPREWVDKLDADGNRIQRTDFNGELQWRGDEAGWYSGEQRNPKDEPVYEQHSQFVPEGRGLMKPTRADSHAPWALAHSDHYAEYLCAKSWREHKGNGSQYARGTVKAGRHDTVELGKRWHRVFYNLEVPTDFTATAVVWD